MKMQCECCLSSNDLKNLSEKYIQLLSYCFRIEFSLKGSPKYICDICVEKVKETSAFRYQILVSQDKLKNCYPSTISNIDVKVEPYISETKFSNEGNKKSFRHETDTKYKIAKVKTKCIEIDQEKSQKSIIENEPPVDVILSDHFANDSSDSSDVWPEENFNVPINLKVESNRPISKSEPAIEKKIIKDEIIMNDFKDSSTKKNILPMKFLTVKLNRITEPNECILKPERRTKKIVSDKNITCNSKKSSDKKNELHEPILKSDPSIEETFSPDNNIASVSIKPPKKRKCENKLPSFRLDKTVLTCELCNANFPTHKLLLSHISVHYSNYVCDTCGKVFSNRRCIQSHRKSHIDLTVSCAVCQKEMKHTSLKSHMKMHSTGSDRKRYPCIHCSERFVSFTTQQIHLKSVHNVAIHKYQCKLCPKKFYLASYLKAHIRRQHTGERILSEFCQVCNKGFSSSSHVQRHMSTHTGEKNFLCYFCFKRYATRNALNTHKKTHPEAVGKYMCLHCTNGFDELLPYYAHVKSVHNK